MFKIQPFRVEAELNTDMPSVFISPANAVAEPGENFTISVMIFNLTNNFYQSSEQWTPGDPLPPADSRFNYSLGNLYGLDVQMSWDPTILEYVDHTVMIPVEEYVDGVLHEPIFTFKDEIDLMKGTYWLARASIYPADVFNNPDGNSTVLTMTFRVVRQGECDISIESKLGYPKSYPGFEDANAAIPHWDISGRFQTSMLYTRIQSLQAKASTGEGLFDPPVINGENTTVIVAMVNPGDSADTFNLTLRYDDTNVAVWVNEHIDPGAVKGYNYTLHAVNLTRGLHTVVVNATILHNNTVLHDSLTHQFRVVDTPELSIVGPDSAWPGETVVYDGSGSSHGDPEGSIEGYTWSLWVVGETQPLLFDQGVNATFELSPRWSGGDYEVVLEVTDGWDMKYDPERSATTPYRMEVPLQVAESWQIYIRADGSVEPETAPIHNTGNSTYTLTGDITYPVYHGITVERSNIVIDGDGYIVQGSGEIDELSPTTGIGVSADNVTIQDVNVKDYYIGIHLIYDYISNVSNCHIYTSNITDNKYGILSRYATGSLFSGNTLEGNRYNLAIQGVELNHFLHVITSSNMANGKGVYYMVNQTDYTITPNTHPQVGFLALVNCQNVTVEGLTLANNSHGILIAHTNNSEISQNTLTSNVFGIECRSSHGNTLFGNIATENSRGISIMSSANITVVNNNLTHNIEDFDFFFGSDPFSCGIRVRGNSTDNRLSNNIVTDNNWGVVIESDPYTRARDNTLIGNMISLNMEDGIYLYGDNNLFVDNVISHNEGKGVMIWHSKGNRFVRNNFVENTRGNAGAGRRDTNIWNDDVEGNYWSDYQGVDVDKDGVGDTIYVISENNTDNHPLMGTTSSYNTTNNYQIHLVSNSTVNSLHFSESAGIEIYVANTTENQNYGFCRLTIPKANVAPPYNITITSTHGDGFLIFAMNVGAVDVLDFHIVSENTSHAIIYFAYEHSEHRIVIIPESSTPLIYLTLLGMITLLVVIPRRRRQHRRRKDACAL